MSNIYYNPEAFGLTKIGEVEAGGSYEFDTFVVWKDDHGTFFWAADEGCSCPTPFDGFNLSNVERGTADKVTLAALGWVDTRKESLTDMHGLIRKLQGE